jgi:hypothetical protein
VGTDRSSIQIEFSNGALQIIVGEEHDSNDKEEGDEGYQ